jgi:replicative DNA helicase
MTRKEIEMSILGTLIAYFGVDEEFYRKAFEYAITRLKPSDFGVEEYKKLFAKILKLHGEGITREEIIVRLKEKYSPLLTYLMDFQVPSFSYFKALVKRLIEFSVEDGKSRLLSKYHEGRVDKDYLFSAIAELEARLSEKDKTTEQAIKEAVERLEKGEEEGYSTGFPKLDFYISFRAGEVSIIGARPSVGKTATGLVMAYEQLKQYPDIKVLFFSMELPAKEIIYRLLAYKCDWKLRDIKSLTIPLDLIQQQAEELQNELQDRLIIYDDPNLTVPLLYSKIREHRPHIVYIDYIQRIVQHKRFESRLQFLNYVSIELTNIAKEFEIPVVVLAQLNRSVRAGRDVPSMENLKDTGHLEQDATNIILLHRDFKKDPRTMLFIVAKCRETEIPQDTISVDFVNGFPHPFEKKEVSPVGLPKEDEQGAFVFEF